MTKNNPEKFKLSEEATKSFELLKQHLANSSLLTSPNPDNIYNLSTDASTSGVGAVLSQLDNQGNDRPVAYFSKRILPYQKHYSATELELLAVVLAVQHFAVYLLGARFRLYTDHKALLHLQKLKTANGRLSRWALILQSHQFDIIYHPGEHSVLSRAFQDDVPSEANELTGQRVANKHSTLEPRKSHRASPEGGSQRAPQCLLFPPFIPGGVSPANKGCVD